jgi:hypothetical protein
MIIHEGVRTFQKQLSQYINGSDIVIIEDAKSQSPKGTFLPYELYKIFEEQVQEAIRMDIRNSFTEEVDGVGVVNEH